MKGSGGGPQVRFRNGPADLFREWRPEAKMLQWCGTLMARSICVLRPLKVAVDIRYSGPRSGLVPAAPCRATAMQVLEKGRLQEQKEKENPPGLSHRKRRECQHLTGQMRGTERCIVKVTPRWFGRFPTGCTNHIVNNGSSSFLRRIPKTPDAE
ncbi:hypothetical protein BDP81DRAFT_2338 [Colletotrichum phormii]|uniref:Uncharacterized protein n=1 Tax=Colletotrichum phormii TaxID=359342 RepID=A0AAJ0A2L2_9PEZI|nr:uncharacterized protein BDP81DRAFT_2338 [Colletotrichum phormii]KAK1655317.1 hypothetical protein BDP81DRAFT_2338 [Colletotrichum phormii]